MPSTLFIDINRQQRKLDEVTDVCCNIGSDNIQYIPNIYILQRVQKIAGRVWLKIEQYILVRSWLLTTFFSTETRFQ